MTNARHARIFISTLATTLLTTLLTTLPALLLAADAHAADALDTGDTAWILVSTALVLFMTIPGLALFYGGLVRTKNVLSVLMQCFALTSVVTLLWLAFGYSLAFEPGNAIIGGLSKPFLLGVTADSLVGTIPEVLFFTFQATFAIITPALIVGAFAERMKFSAMILFCSVWLVVVYLPICHMTWGGGYFAEIGVFDFAGGIVVHITAGIAALVACIVIGPRKGYPSASMRPHNLTMTVIGTGMLWVGWFGFNAGSALGANGGAAMALTVTHLSACTASVAWVSIEWVKHGKPSVLGFVTGAVAGLAAITPAAGVAGPLGALMIGAASGCLCFLCSTTIKSKFGYDDSLDVFGVHGVGGFVGTLLAAVVAIPALGGNQPDVVVSSQFVVQCIGAFGTAIYTGLASFIILKVVDATIGLRVTDRQETEGLDLALHDESGYNI
ncbi:MAG: Amt family ammonium transporter [Hyphomicrobiaceae bacterium]|jgi:Amt family ammonium transporter